MADASPSANNAKLLLQRVYLKDASLESPSSPASFQITDWKPKFEVDVSSRSTQVASTHYEIVLRGLLEAKQDDKVLYIVEVLQAGLFQIENCTEEQMQAALRASCPTTLFPYLRESLDNLIVRAGFPAMMLAHINFEQMYLQALQNQASD